MWKSKCQPRVERMMVFLMHRMCQKLKFDIIFVKTGVSWTHYEWLNDTKFGEIVYRRIERFAWWGTQWATIFYLWWQSIHAMKEKNCFAYEGFFLLARNFKLSIMSHNLLPIGYRKRWHCSSIWRYKLWYFGKMNISTGVVIMLNNSPNYILQAIMKYLVPLFFTFF